MDMSSQFDLALHRDKVPMAASLKFKQVGPLGKAPMEELSQFLREQLVVKDLTVGL